MLGPTAAGPKVVIRVDPGPMTAAKTLVVSCNNSGRQESENLLRATPADFFLASGGCSALPCLRLEIPRESVLQAVQICARRRDFFPITDTRSVGSLVRFWPQAGQNLWILYLSGKYKRPKGMNRSGAPAATAHLVLSTQDSVVGRHDCQHVHFDRGLGSDSGISRGTKRAAGTDSAGERCPWYNAAGSAGRFHLASRHGPQGTRCQTNGLQQPGSSTVDTIQIPESATIVPTLVTFGAKPTWGSRPNNETSFGAADEAPILGTSLPVDDRPDHRSEGYVLPSPTGSAAARGERAAPWS